MAADLPDPRNCDQCERTLVTRKMLARAVHSGCALTGELHGLEACPSRLTFERDARFLWENMQRQAAKEA